MKMVLNETVVQTWNQSFFMPPPATRDFAIEKGQPAVSSQELKSLTFDIKIHST